MLGGFVNSIHNIWPYKSTFTYESIPELDKTDILPQSGLRFDGVENEELATRFFITSIGKALQEPEWLLYAKGSDKYNLRRYFGLPVPQNIRQNHIDRITKFREDGDLTNIAEGINRYSEHINSQLAAADIVVRALEIMSTKYPNLSMFRGTGFHPKDKFSGVDFAPGHLPTALRYTKKNGEEWKKYPVIVSIKFSDIVNEYTAGRMTIGTEGYWWRNSIELRRSCWEGKEGVENIYPKFVMRRLPQDPEKVASILNWYNLNCIDLRRQKPE